MTFRIFAFALALVLGLRCSVLAQQPWQPVVAVPNNLLPAAPFSTWDTTVNPGSVTFSNGNLTWTCSGCAGIEAVGLGSNNHTTGKFHAEITTAGAFGCCYSLGIGAFAAIADNALGAHGNSIDYSPGGTVYINNPTSLATISGYAPGDTICIEVDASSHLLWLQDSGSTGWNQANFTATISGTTMTVPVAPTGFLASGMAINSGASPGTLIMGGAGTLWSVSIPQTISSPTAMTAVGVPATGSGGINIAALVSPILYPAISAGFSSTAEGTLNVGASAFSCPLTSGFSAWH